MKINTPLFLLTLSLFMTGAAGLITEYILATVSSYILGSSIEQFSITMAIMMGFMGLGGFMQKYVNDENLIVKFIILELCLAILSSFSPIAIYAAFGLDNFNLIYYFFTASIGFLVGFEIPFITRINTKYTENLKENLSWVFSMDYLGAMIGGAIVWTIFLLPHVPLTQIGFIVASFNLMIAVITFYYFSKEYNLPRKLFTFIFIGVFALFVVSYYNVLDWAKVLEQKMYSDKIVDSKITKYQNIVITKNQKTNDVRLYLSGNTQMSSTDEVRYHELLVHPVMNFEKSNKNVLVFGGGDGLAVRELKKYENNSITLVDIDKEMIAFSKTNKYLSKLNENAFDDFKEIDMFKLEEAKKYLNSPNIAGNHILYSDANTFLNGFIYSERVKKYDIVIIDLPDPRNLQLNKLYTVQFYKKLRLLMSENGRVVIQSTSPYYAKEAFLMIGRTLESSGFNTYPYQHDIPSFGNWGWWIGSKVAINPKDVIISVKTQYINDALFKGSLAFGNGALDSKRTDINSLMEPKLMQIYNTESWKLY